VTVSAVRSATAQILEEQGVEEILRAMVDNSHMNTRSSYSANASLHPDNQITFVEKHMTYLLDHPKVVPAQYLANLRLMIKVR
jgi:hypothetical protein